MNIYREKHIDLDKLLTINFQGATVPLVDSGDNLTKLEELEKSNRCTILIDHPFWGSKIMYKKEWDYVYKAPLRYKKYHTITINMDPSKMNYSSSLSRQKTILFDIIRSFQNKIKYLSLIYEYGRSKLHWHILINITSVKDFQEALEKEFGKGRAVCVKKVQENNNETLASNILRILDYFKKEEHNKETVLLCKI